jgi:hypothetical protein
MTPQDLYVTIDVPGKNTRICDVCGKPAWCAAYDIQEIPSDDMYKRFKTRGKVKLGCEDHQVVSHTYDVDGKLIR